MNSAIERGGVAFTKEAAQLKTMAASLDKDAGSAKNAMTRSACGRWRRL